MRTQAKGLTFDDVYDGHMALFGEKSAAANTMRGVVNGHKGRLYREYILNRQIKPI
jgi:hypothetical protein